MRLHLSAPPAEPETPKITGNPGEQQARCTAS
jgi:hypothetical protein